MFEGIKNIFRVDSMDLDAGNMIIPLLDPGHGGMSPGAFWGDRWLYLTKGKQSLEVPPGIHEGDFNEDICRRIKRMCDNIKMPSAILRQGPVNTPMSARVAYANSLHAIHKNTFYINVHANAQRLKKGQVWGGAQGSVVFCHPRSKQGNIFAENLADVFERSGRATRGIKHSRWMYTIRKTHMPACLVECAFMTNLEEAKFMASGEGRETIAHEIFMAICSYRVKRSR